MLKFYRALFLLIILICLPIFLSASTKQNKTTVFYLIDADNRSISEIKDTEEWKTYNSNLFSVKTRAKAVWIKLDKTLLRQHKETFLRVNSEALIICDIYKIKNNEVISVEKFGKLTSQTTPTLLQTQTLISLESQPNEIYMKLLQIPALSISFDFIDYQEVIESTENIALMNGLFFGILFFLLLYNFVLYMYTKFTPYVPYLFYVLGALFYFLVTDTFYLQSWWILEHINMMIIFHLAMTTSLVGMLLFPVWLLDFSKYYPRFKQFIVAAIIMIVIFGCMEILLVYFGQFDVYSIVFDLESLLILLGSLSLLFVSYRLAFKGDRIALYYSIAWSILFIALINYMIQNYYFESNRLVAQNYFRLAIVIEGLLFSFLLAFRIRELERLEEIHHQVLTQEKHNDQITSMLNEVAHQWRQPLNAINAIIFENTLREKVPDKNEWKMTLNEIEDLISFLSSTIEEFQNHYLESDSEKDFLIKEVWEQTLYILSRKMKEHQVACECNIDETVSIQGSPGYFTQVLLILLNNAIEAFPIEQNEKHIYLSIHNDDKDIIVSIEDNAGGLDENLLKQLLKHPVTSKEGHHGLGLSLAKKIINKSFHGILELQNTQKGLRCLIRIPNEK